MLILYQYLKSHLSLDIFWEEKNNNRRAATYIFLSPLSSYNPWTPTSVIPNSSSGNIIPSHNTGQYAACCKFKVKDLQYDCKSSWKAFLHKFVILLSRSSSQQRTDWTVQTVLLLPGRNCQRVQHTVTRIKSGPTLHRYPEEVRQALRLISAWWLPICSQEQQWVPDAKVRPCTYWQLVRSPCCQISTLMPYVVSAMEPRCGRQTCNGQTKTVDEVVDRMQYYKHSGRSRHLRANYNAARSVTRNRQEKVVRRAESEMQTWRRWMQQLEKTFNWLQGSSWFSPFSLDGNRAQ